MADAYDDNATDVGLSLDLIEEEIEAGLPMHADRLTRAYINEEYYACRNAAFICPRQSEEWIDFVARPKRTSKITRKVIRKLAEHLYAPGPTRKLENGADVDAILQGVYASNHVNALMTQADRKATLNGGCLVMAEATGNPKKPISLSVWGAHEFVAYPRPDDPTEAWAIVTIGKERKLDGARLQERLRFVAWSRDEHRVYLTAWRDVIPETTTGYARASYRGCFGQTAVFQPELSGWSEDGEHHAGHNPYGCLPFVIISDETKVCSLYEGGVGDALVECNAELDRELSDLAAHVKEFMDPDRFTRNVSAKWRREKSRGRWQELTAMQGAKEGDHNLEPDAFLVQAELAVEQVLANMMAYANMTIEELDVPLTAVRMDASTDLSGVAIVGKMLPLLQRTKQRQAEPFTQHEVDLASMILCVYGNFYHDNSALAAAEDTDLSVIWPEPSFPLPTPERDDEDQKDIDAGRKSTVQVVAERNGMTTEQAKAQLERVADDNIWYAEMLKSKGVLPEPEPEPNAVDEEPNPFATPPEEEQPNV